MKFLSKHVVGTMALAGLAVWGGYVWVNHQSSTNAFRSLASSAGDLPAMSVSPEEMQAVIWAQAQVQRQANESLEKRLGSYAVHAYLVSPAAQRDFAESNFNGVLLKANSVRQKTEQAVTVLLDPNSYQSGQEKTLRVAATVVNELAGAFPGGGAAVRGGMAVAKGLGQHYGDDLMALATTDNQRAVNHKSVSESLIKLQSENADLAEKLGKMAAKRDGYFVNVVLPVLGSPDPAKMTLDDYATYSPVFYQQFLGRESMKVLMELPRDPSGNLLVSPDQLKKIQDEIVGTIRETRADIMRQIQAQNAHAEKAMAEQVARDRAQAQAQAVWNLNIQASTTAVNTFSSLIGLRDPQMARKIAVTGNAVISVVAALKTFQQTSALASQAATIIATGNIVGAVLSVVSLFGDAGPSPDEMIMDSIRVLQDSVNDLRREMGMQFRELDARLVEVYKGLSQQLDLIASDVRLIHTKVDLSNSQLSVLQNQLAFYFADLRHSVEVGTLREDLKVLREKCLNYRRNFPDTIMPETIWVDCVSTFKDVGINQSVDSLALDSAEVVMRSFSGRGVDIDRAPATLARMWAFGSISFRGNPRHMDAAALVASSIPNAKYWIFAASGFSDLLADWKNLPGAVSEQIADEFIEQGQMLINFVRLPSRNFVETRKRNDGSKAIVDSLFEQYQKAYQNFTKVLAEKVAAFKQGHGLGKADPEGDNFAATPLTDFVWNNPIHPCAGFRARKIKPANAKDHGGERMEHTALLKNGFEDFVGGVALPQFWGNLPESVRRGVQSGLIELNPCYDGWAYDNFRTTMNRDKFTPPPRGRGSPSFSDGQEYFGFRTRNYQPDLTISLNVNLNIKSGGSIGLGRLEMRTQAFPVHFVLMKQVLMYEYKKPRDQAKGDWHFKKELDTVLHDVLHWNYQDPGFLATFALRENKLDPNSLAALDQRLQADMNNKGNVLRDELALELISAHAPLGAAALELDRAWGLLQSSLVVAFRGNLEQDQALRERLVGFTQPFSVRRFRAFGLDSQNQGNAGQGDLDSIKLGLRNINIAAVLALDEEAREKTVLRGSSGLKKFVEQRFSDEKFDPVPVEWTNTITRMVNSRRKIVASQERRQTLDAVIGQYRSQIKNRLGL